MASSAPPHNVPRLHWLLAAVAAWHLLAWALAPSLLYRSLPLDALELLGWGQEWQWGYYKHPPLAPWLGEAWLRLCGGRLESLYLLAQLGVLLAFGYVWRIARLVLDPARAVLATVLLEGSYSHTLLSTNFNINLLQLPLWAGLSYHFLRALRGAPHHWLACGALAAACLLTKYSGVLLCASCAAVLLAVPAGRAALRTPWPWAGGALGAALLAPHLAWLQAHDYLPLQYLRGFDGAAPDLLRMHVLEPLRFAAGALLGMLFSGLLFGLLQARGGRPELRRQEALILAVLCFGPLLLAMLYGVGSGSRLKSTWAFPFFNLLGVVLFLFVPTDVGRPRLRRFVAALAGVALLFFASHLIYKQASDRPKTAFDAAALAREADAAWRRHQPTPLRIVAADHVLSAIVSSYGAARPSMLVDGDYRLSPWVTPERLRRDGALVLCEAGHSCLAAAALRAPAARDTVEVQGRRFELRIVPPAAGVPR